MKCGSVGNSEKVGEAILGMAGNILMDSTSVSDVQLEVRSEGTRPARASYYFDD